VFGERFRRFFVCAGVRPADAEDLAWETLGAFFRDLDRVHDPRHARGVLNWVYGIARHKAADWRRRNEVGTIPLEGIQDCLVQPASEDVPGTGLLHRAVARGLAQLHAEDRELLVLRSSDASLTFGEIGRMLGISEGAARTRYARARKRAQKVLEAIPEVQDRLASKKAQQNGSEYGGNRD